MSEAKVVSVALLGRNALAREGLRRILNEGTFRVTQSLACSDILLDQPANDWEPDLIVVDESDGVVGALAVERLRRSFAQSHLVVLVDTFDFDGMVEAFRSGANGYIVKKINCESLIESLRLVTLGEKVMPSQLADHLLARTADGAADAIKTANWHHLLSDREVETMRYLLMGCSNKVIANRLEITEATVKVHVKAILRKLRVQNRTQAAIWAVNNGVDLPGMLADGKFDGRRTA